MQLDHQDTALQTVAQEIWDTLDDSEKRRHIAAVRLSHAQQQFETAMAQAVTTPEPPAVLVPATQVIRRKAYFLRMCGCGHVGKANFHNGDESAAFELIASNTWRCGFCLTDKPNPGKDDAEYAAATKKVAV